MKKRILTILLTITMISSYIAPVYAMQIFIELNIQTQGNHITLQVEQSDTIESIKAKIQDKNGINPNLQTLYYDDKVLEDNRILTDYNIQEGATLDLVTTVVAYNCNQKKAYISLETALSESLEGDVIELWAETNRENVTLPPGVELFANEGYTGTVSTNIEGKGVCEEFNFGWFSRKFYITNSYSITYYDQGGNDFSGVHDEGYPTTFVIESNVQLKSASKTGYDFDGWYDNSDCTGDPLTGWYLYTYINNVNLYAKWGINKYTVTFNENGHGTAPESIENVEYNTKIVKPLDPSEDKFEFNGWYKEETCTSKWDFDNDVVTDNITLYAKWNYQIIEGKDLEINIDNESDVAFISSADYDKFFDGANIITSCGVKVDGLFIDSSNYTHEPGSTKITLKSTYLSALDVGEHVLSIVSLDGQADTPFTITKSPIPTPTPTPDPTPEYVIPKTGVDGAYPNNHSLLKVSSLSLLAIGTYIAIKKKKDNY